MQTLSPNGLSLIERFEGLRLTAYQDSVGVWTIGYGHTGPVNGQPIHAGLTITQAVAAQLLRNDVATAEACVHSAVTHPLTQNQFDALVDFVFNCGAASLLHSTLLHKLNLGDIAGAAGEFPRWAHAGGKILPGLLKRREAEAALFLAA